MKRTKDKSLQRVFERPKKICCWQELRIWPVQIYNWNSNYEPAASSKSSTRYPHHQTFRFLELNQRWWLRDRFPVWLRGIFYIYNETRIGNRPEHVSVGKKWLVSGRICHLHWPWISDPIVPPLAHWESHLSPPHPVGSKCGDRGSHRRSVRHAPGSLREFLGWKIAQGSRTWCLYGWYRFPKVIHLIIMVAIQQALS